ncbi:PAS domain S-box protein [Fusibacter paucivorans]|uniref:histidine kinase n=1 Tax=Fusibacter paucivorans TaxID=76009 RepID=A0ABS5PJQ5_9FIRM|nr:ATP-binding protein [Fusibacter paucivorans]MBS7525072.1 PAS domain S-box protein [Fusibacter paucivorans]
MNIRHHKIELKSLIILVFSSVVMLIIVSASYLNYKAIQDNVVEIEQYQLLSQAQTLAKSIENFFTNQRHNLEILAKNRNFINDLKAYSEVAEAGDDIYKTQFQNIVDYYVIQSDNIELIRIVDSEGAEIFSYPSIDYGQGLEVDLPHVKAVQSTVTGDIYKENGYLYVNVLEPVCIEDELTAVLYVKVKLDTIYYAMVAPVKAGDMGYASVKDSDGVLIMHPNREDIGVDVIEARVGAYPEFDWSELLTLIEKQKRGESGVGIYHSLWFTDNDQKRVKKFNAFAPAFIGNDFWVINISKDYEEVVTFLKQRTYAVMIVNFFIVLLYVTILFYAYRRKKDRALMEKERMLLTQVKSLNEELEEDIAKRIILEKELIMSRNKFQNIFQSGSDCIFVINTKDPGKIDEVNDKVVKSLEFEKVELLGKRYFDISSIVTEKYLEKLLEELKRNQNVMFEDTLKANHGKTIPVEINVRILEDEKAEQLVMISRDISIKKRYESEMEEKKRWEALMIYQSRLAAMGEMIGSIAHQWRQPLSGISMIFNNLEDAYHYNELDEDYLKKQGKRMQALVKYMSQTIDDFRFFFNPKNDREDFLISSVVDRTLEFLNESVRLNNIEIIYELEKDSLIYGRPNQLSQVLFSILKNAIDAIVICEADLRKIWIKILQNEDQLTIEIEDTGGGTAHEHLIKIFDAYYTTKEAHNGTGLGLYISKVIVEKNFSGRIMARNGQYGLCITMVLPLIHPEEMRGV